MTINELQNELIKEIELLTRDMELINKKREPVALKGYSQAIPVSPLFEAVPYNDFTGNDEFPNEESLFPYFVVRVDHVEYQKKDAESANQAHVMIVFAVYDEDPGLKGYYTLTAVMERVIMRFQSNPVLGSFYCSREMSVAYQEDDTFPQFFGGLEMVWNLPDIEMEDFNG